MFFYRRGKRGACRALLLSTIIMSSERPSKIRKIAGSFEGLLSSLFHLSREPTSSSIEMDSGSDSPTTKCVTKYFSSTFYWNSLLLSSVSPLNMIPVVGVDHAPTTAFATKTYPQSPGPPITAPVHKQLGSGCGRGLETQPTVSDHPYSRLSLLMTSRLVHVSKSIIALVA